MSKGNPLASSKVKHSIVIHLDQAIFRGLGSTNIQDFRSLLKSDMAGEIFKNISFSGDTPFDFISALVSNLGGGSISYKYHEFDTVSKSYTNVDINEGDILDLIKYHEKNKEEGKIETDDQRKTIRKIQNSLEGAIIGEYTKQDQTYKAVSVFFLKSDKGNARKIVSNGIPIIADYPRTEAGTRYSFGATVAHQQSGVNGENIGVYQTLSEDTDDPSDKVAGPMRMTYDRSTGTWNVSNQLLVVAADNIPSANIRSLDEIDSLTAGDLSPQDFSVGTVDVKPQKAIGNFFTGRGVVFSPERGNPNLFTPNFCACDGEQPVEIIRIVNRTNSNISKGSLLLCNYISGEWIPTVIKEGEPVASAAKNWSFSQFVVSSDFFFKDYRYYTGRRTLQGDIFDGDPAYTQSILSSYKSKVRLKYYADWQASDVLHEPQWDLVSQNWARPFPTSLVSEIAGDSVTYTDNDWNLNIPPAYFQFSNFDFVSPKLGGQCVGTILGRTNISYGQETYRVVSEAGNGGDIFPVGYDFPHFWGAILTEGYTTSTTANLVGQTAPYVGIGPMVSNGGTIDISNDIIASREWARAKLTEDLYWTGQTGLGLFGDISDISFKQLPADIATHSSPDGKNGSPIKIPNIIGDIRALNVYENLRPSLSYLQRTDGKEVYDLKPNNSNIIQFTPLSYHTLALDRTVYKQGNWNINGSNTAGFYSVGAGIDPELYSSFTQEYDNPLFFIYDGARDLIGAAYQDSTIWPLRYLDIKDEDGRTLWRPLNPFLRSTTVQYAPFPWDYFWSDKGRGANMIGIIGASTTISLAGKKEFPISVEQNLGVYKETSVMGGGVTMGSFVGIGLGTSFGGFSSTPITTRQHPQWGNNDTQDALGGAVLYLQCYEAWDPKDTWFDARYNTVFHFNPKKPTTPNTKEVFPTVDPPASITDNDYTNGLLNKNFRRTVDEILTEVEHRVPSVYNHSTKSHDVMEIGTIINKDSKLAPTNEWRVERCRNNKLLPFSFEKLVISLNISGHSIITKGSGFEVNDEISGSKGVKIKVTAVDDNGGITNFSLSSTGEGFLPKDFAGEGYDLTIRDAKIRFTSGIVDGKIYTDPGPKQIFAPTLISVPSKRGENFGLQSKEATISVGSETTSNQFDLFFWFQNDVTYTSMFYLGKGTDSQYVKVTFN